MKNLPQRGRQGASTGSPYDSSRISEINDATAPIYQPEAHARHRWLTIGRKRASSQSHHCCAVARYEKY